jgi:magnesium chelatase subunit I
MSTATDFHATAAPKHLPRTLGELKASGYRSVSVKDEIRRNLIRKLRAKEPLFPGIVGYEDTVIPQIQNGILAKHDLLFLGLRGQAKTRMLRSLVSLLDDHLPVVAGSEVNDDPLRPLSAYAKRLIAEKGDETPIDYVTPRQRFHEKLATPDVTIADLLGEVDMVKHAEGRYLSSEDVMHFGLIPRTNRGIFAINELPDLAPKIQVGLFNVLEERDVQIRGFGVRLELDVCLVFSANPEDYTNRGRIVTPLKDRIGSVVRTHYPVRREEGMKVTAENAWADRDAGVRVSVPVYMAEVLEEAVREARKSPHINQRSGVSVRAGIANYEVMVSNAERRGLSQGLSEAVPRVSDLAYLSAASRGKVELMMADDDVTEDKIIASLVGEAVKTVFNQHFEVGDFAAFVQEVKGNVQVEVGDGVPAERYVELLDKHKVLRREANKLAEKLRTDHGVKDPLTPEWQASIAEFILEGLYVHNKLSKYTIRGRTLYKK